MKIITAIFMVALFLPNCAQGASLVGSIGRTSNAGYPTSRLAQATQRAIDLQFYFKLCLNRSSWRFYQDECNVINSKYNIQIGYRKSRRRHQ